MLIALCPLFIYVIGFRVVQLQTAIKQKKNVFFEAVFLTVMILLILLFSYFLKVKF